MIFTEKPNDFNQRLNVVGCLCEFEGKILLVLRHQEETQGNTWGLPSGRVEKDEELTAAIKREVFEETGINASIDEFTYIDKSYVRHSDADLIYHLFLLKLSKSEKVVIDPKEHQQFQWLTPQEAMLLQDGIEDLAESIKIYYK